MLYFFIGLLKHEVLRMHTFMFYLFQLFKSKLGIINCIKRGFFLFFLGGGVSLNICDEPRYKNVDKICSVDLLNGHEWRKVGCVVENKL